MHLFGAIDILEAHCYVEYEVGLVNFRAQVRAQEQLCTVDKDPRSRNVL